MKRSTIAGARAILSRFAALEAELRRLVASERDSLDNGLAQPVKDPGDQVDHAFETTWLAREDRMVEHYLGEIEAISAARARLENGTFGICAECGERIDSRRLGAELTAVRCADCQQRYEHIRALHH